MLLLEPGVSIAYWRERIVNRLIDLSFYLGIVPIIVSIYGSLDPFHWPIFTVDVFLLTVFSLLYIKKDLNYSVKAYLYIAAIFITGFYYSMDFGPFAVGLFILFIVAPVSAVLVEKKYLNIIFVLNNASMIVLIIADQYDLLSWKWSFSPYLGAVFITTWVFLSGLLTYAIDEAISGLNTSLNQLYESKIDLKKAYIDSVSRLVTATEYKDEVTGKHIARIGNYSALLAARFGFDKYDVEEIYYASLMHDIGKIGIPDDVLKTEATYSIEQFELMKTHTTYGAAILANSDISIIQKAEKIAHYHHEKWDGSGYPEGLAGKEIPIEARIVTICDVYDALTSRRPYKEPYTEAAAIAYLEEHKGLDFDPYLVDLFVRFHSEIIIVKTAFEEASDFETLYNRFYQFQSLYFN
jgi:HD-GYP domain-containing protein (c-di-GMP phosphodiesterase class II)